MKRIADCQLPIADFRTFGFNKLAIGNRKLEIDYGFINQRYSLCGEGPIEEAGVCGDCGDHPGAWDRREHGDLQPCEYGAAARVAGRSSKRDCLRCCARQGRLTVGLLVSQLQRLPRSQRSALRSARLSFRAAKLESRRR